MDTNAVGQEPVFRAGLRQAVEIAGGQTELGRRSGIPQQTIWWLLTTARKMSAEDAVAIDRATEGRVSKHSLRPDLFDAPSSSEPSHAAAAT